MTPAQVVDAFDLAIRSVADPDSLGTGQLGRLEQAQEAWSPVVDLQKGLFETQYGILDPRSPETVALLAGDEVLPYEMARVMEGHAKQMEPLLKERERRQDRVDRARGRVRLDDDLIESKGAGLAARGRELDSLAVKLIDAEGGVEYMAELLDPDNKVWTEIPEAKLPAWVRGQVRDRLNGRAMLLDQGQALPADIFSDAVEASGLKALPLEPSQKGRAKVRSQAGQEAVARQAGQDVDRLGRRIDTLEGRADRLADALETAINERPRPAGATKVKAAVKAELKADRAVRSAAGAYARLKNALRDGEVLSTPALIKAFQDIRKAALPILDEVADNTWVRLEDEYGVRDTVVLGDTHIDDAVRVVEAVAQRTGLDVDQVLGYGPTGRKSATPYLSLTDPDTGRAFGHLVDGEVRAVEAEQGGVFGDAARGSSSGLEVISGSLGAKRLTDGSMDATVAKLVDDISEIINANEMRRWIKGTRKVKQKGGVRRAQATQGGMRAYLSSEMGIDMLDSVLTAMDEDPALVYAAFSDDPVAATRELALEWFDEGWANVPGEASVAAQAALAAADEAAGPQRMLAGGEDLAGPIVKAARDEYIADFDHPEVAGAAFDAAFARLQQGLARKVTEHAASIDPSLRAASQRTARGAGQAGRRLGRMEGETAGLRREQGINERRAARGADDLEGAEYAAGLEQLERGERHGQAEGRRLEKLRFEEAELAKVNRRIASVDAKLAEDLAAAMEKVTSAPANYRVALSTSRALGEVLADVKGVVDDPHMAALLDRTHAEMVTTVVDALDMLNPEYVAGGRLPGSSGSGGGFAPAVNKAKSEYLKDGVLSPMTDGAQMVMVARNLELLARNQMVIRILGKFGKTADGLLGEDAAGLRGDAVVRAIDEASDMPMVAVNPRKPLDARLKPAEIRPDTVFIPRWVADAMDHQFQQAGAAEKLARTFIDAPTRVWKHGVLALSPRWHMGNIVGNVLMAWAAGIPPHRMLALVREAKILTDGGELPGIGGTPGRLGGSGTGVEHQRIMHSVTDLAAADRATEGSRALEAGMMREVSRGHGPIRNRLQRRLDDRTDPNGRTNKLISGAMSPVQSSYKMNGWVDDFFHNIVYLDEMKKGANPEAAIKQSLKVAGDFSTMTKVERSIVRRALPFYSWMRHITKLSADLAVNHPARVAWNLHLWTLFADDDADFSDIPSLFGSIQTDDDKFIRARSYMPFGSVIDMDPADPFGTLASSASPVFKLPLEIGTGIEAGPGGLSKMSTSSGEFGDRGLKPIGWNATISRLGKLTPQTRAAQELLRGPTDRTVRYGTGEDILKNGRPIPDVDKQSNKDIIMRSLLGLPLPATSDPAAIRARDRQRGR